MAAKVRKCARCRRRLRGGGDDWSVALELDEHNEDLRSPGEIWCGGCTTELEYLEREINDSTVDYLWRGDRVLMWPKAI